MSLEDLSLEISYEEYRKLPTEEYVLVDVRDEASAAYGRIPGSVHIPQEELEKRMSELPQGKKLILYCTRGLFSAECAQTLREKGFLAQSLEGGYTGWLLQSMEEAGERENGNERAEEIEKSIRKKFHKALFTKFARAINEYDLVRENDRIAVCISGGKDSMLMAKLFQEL